MGYALMISPCLICGLPFGYNPRYVPSIKGEPVCRDCIERENSDRDKEEEPQRPKLTYHPQAYDPINEEELP